MNRIIGLVVCCVVASLTGNTNADIIFESATLGSDGQTGGPAFGQLTGATAVIGVRFSISERTQVNSVGGHVFGARSRPDPVSAAIIGLPFDEFPPIGNDLSQMDVRASSLWDLEPSPSSEQFVDLDVILEVGEYALLFGGAQPGATGAGAMPTGSRTGGEDIGDPVYLYFTDINNAGWHNQQRRGHRFVVRGQAIPEPASATMLIGMVAVITFRRRR